MLLNGDLHQEIQWYSKQQLSVETSTFGVGFYVMKVAVIMVEAMRYKLRRCRTS